MSGDEPRVSAPRPTPTPTHALREHAAALVDQAAGGRVIVFGSLPPDGRDLDVLARDAEHAAIAAALDDAGFHRSGRVWVRFAACTAFAVELVQAADWGLRAAELDRLFDEADPLPGRRHLAAPAPHHTLLLLAPRAAANGGLDARRRQRVRTALLQDAHAWARARQRASAWQSRSTLEVLESLDTGRSVDRATRAGAIADTMVAEGVSGWRARLRAWRVVLDAFMVPRGAIVAFSGLDGAGKSSQAEALRDVLDALGHPAAVEWARIAYDPTLAAIGEPVKAFVGRLLPGRARVAGATSDHVTSGAIASDTGDVQRHNIAVESLWAVVTALVDAHSHRARVRRHVRRGRVVICDRYALDTAVHLHERFAGVPLTIAARISRALSPAPLRAWLLSVPADTAYARKPQEFDVERLRRHAALYTRLHRSLGVVEIDGTRPRAELCSQIGQQTWLALQQRPQRSVVGWRPGRRRKDVDDAR